MRLETRNLLIGLTIRDGMGNHIMSLCLAVGMPASIFVPKMGDGKSVLLLRFSYNFSHIQPRTIVGNDNLKLRERLPGAARENEAEVFWFVVD